MASVHDLITGHQEELERVWSNTVERRMNYVFELIDARTLFESRNADHVQYLKDCMALHWARSFVLTAMVGKFAPGYAEQIATAVLREYPAQQVVQVLTGVFVPTDSADAILRKRIRREFEARLHGAFMRDQFERHYYEAKRRINTYSLEIGVAGASEFVLSDCPVVTWDRDRDVAGVLYGASWAQADVIFMPVGPKQVVALAKLNRYRDLNEGEVVTLNRLQVKAAYREIYYRPLSDVGSKIAAALDANS